MFQIMDSLILFTTLPYYNFHTLCSFLIPFHLPFIFILLLLLLSILQSHS